jgi:hypothetical protein
MWSCIEIVGGICTPIPILYFVPWLDNKQRDPEMDTIKITIKPEERLISIVNNRKEISVAELKDKKSSCPL